MSESTKRQRTVWYVVGGIAIVAFLAYGAKSFTESLTPYVGFEEAMASPSAVQINGSLVESSFSYDEASQLMHFTLVDDAGITMPVTYTGVKPGNFEEATMIVAIGRYNQGAFEAQQLLVKCPSKYQGVEETKVYGSST